jgi:glycerol transport system ATP-binding protein
MATIELREVAHSYASGEAGDFAVQDVDLTWGEGSANALLGPSGCGKTTLLNIISGLLRPSRGRVLFNGQDVTDRPPRERHIAQVFQFPVVYDTITVYDNLVFPLKNADVPASERRQRVEQIADLLDLGPLLRVSAGKISQAEKQKVSLGRGIVRKDTAAILLDEPLTVIDPKERYVLRRKLRQVQQELKITMIYVTHDQHEALTFADSVAVMNEGRIVQVASPAQLHADPASPFVGYFIGSPGMNLLDCSFSDGVLAVAGTSKPLSDAMRDRAAPHGTEFRLGIRPEFVVTSAQERAGWIPAAVHLVENMGTHKILTLATDGVTFKSRVAEDMAVAEGARVWVDFPEDRVKLFKGDETIV